ncbi:MAG: DUF2267 domain-containing protein [Candidatus Omnitrophota bacterium]
MDYQTFIDEVRETDYVKDEETADAAIKAVLGILASEVDEETAHRMTDQLPEPLTYDRLRGRQQDVMGISFDENVAEFSDQFNLREDDSVQLIRKIYHVSKEALDPGIVWEITESLPPEWADEFDRA